MRPSGSILRYTKRDAMSDDLTQPLDDTELDELNELLAARGDGDAMLLDGAQGLVTAVAIGPGAIGPEEWMPYLIDHERAFDSVEQAERVVRLLLRLHATVADELEQLTYEPILGQVETESGGVATSARGWCEGFSIGVDLRNEIWDERLREDPRLSDVLGPVIALATDEGVFEHGDDDEPAPLSETEYEDALAKVGAAIIDTQQYWRDNPPGAALPEPLDPAHLRSKNGHSLH
jgi:uncharacterized protein